MARHRAARFSLLVLLLALLAPVVSHGQVITTDPAFPTTDQPLTVYFNAAGTPLEGYGGTVYAHTGVNTADNPWQCVIGDWGANDVQPALTRDDTDRYSLQIDDVATFYDLASCSGVADVSEVTGLSFVFRSADGNTQTSDLAITFSTGDLAVALTEPTTDPFGLFFTERDTTVEVVATATAAESLRLLVDGAQVATTTESTLSYDLTLDVPGRVDVWAIAEAGVEADTAQFYAVRNPDVVTEARPDGLQDGITYSDDGTSATLSLYAPGKNFVYVIGAFTGWEVDPDYFMKRDGDYFWLTIDGLTPGEEYGFQYLVDGQIRVTDPYVEKVLTPNDQYISDETYPSLESYPAGQTEHVVGVLQPGAEAYEWQVTDFDAPDQHELVVYELLVRDFLAAHDYETLTDTLDYIERLGINAIELMPVSEFDGNESWGYNPSFHFALDKYYGTEEAFKRFVDEAHARGIAVILDVVYNHATGQSPLIRLWNDGDYGAPTADNPYANPTARHPFNVFNDLNHESAATQYWLDRVNRFWLEEYNIDGYRFDLTKGFTQTDTGDDVGAWSAYDQSRVDLLTRMTDEIWEVDPDAYVIFEHLGVNEEEEVYAEYRTDEGLPGIMLWSNLNHDYGEAVMGYASDFSWASYQNRAGWDVPNNVVYMESHDEERLMYRALQYGSCTNFDAGDDADECATEPGAYNVRDLATALDRMAMAGAFIYTIPGPKMIWQFGEMGYDVSIDVNGRTGNKPIRWGEYWTATDEEAALRRQLYASWSALIHLRNAHEVFTSPETDIQMDTDGAVKRITLVHPDGEQAVVLGNFGVTNQQASFSFPAVGTWYDFFEEASFEVTSTSRSIGLPPGDFMVYTSMEPAVSPDVGVVRVDAEDVAEVPQAFGLEQNYPNPFNPSTTIAYTLEHPVHARLDVFDVLGRRVATLVDGAQPAGRHMVTFEAGTLPSGLYLYRLEAGERSETRRMLLVK